MTRIVQILAETLLGEELAALSQIDQGIQNSAAISLHIRSLFALRMVEYTAHASTPSLNLTLLGARVLFEKLSANPHVNNPHSDHDHADARGIKHLSAA